MPRRFFPLQNLVGAKKSYEVCFFLGRTLALSKMRGLSPKLAAGVLHTLDGSVLNKVINDRENPKNGVRAKK